MSDLTQAVLTGAEPGELLACELPSWFRAAYTRRDETGMFTGMSDKDVRRSVHVGRSRCPSSPRTRWSSR